VIASDCKYLSETNDLTEHNVWILDDAWAFRVKVYDPRKTKPILFALEEECRLNTMVVEVVWMHSFFCQGASVETVVQHEKPKLDFLTEDLKVNSQSLVRLTKSHPDIWAYSLEHTFIRQPLRLPKAVGTCL
jgi:hypothetical protein